ncbi:MAG: DUF4147 domain-containing protein [Pseudomonadota bacterium]
MMTAPTRDLLLNAFDTAVMAVHPRAALARYLPPVPDTGRLIVLAAGKAAGAMAQAAEMHYLGLGLSADRLSGLSISRYGYGAELTVLDNREAGHPKPDQAGVDATCDLMALANSATRDDLVLCLLSGGGSAVLCAPAPGVTLADKQGLTSELLAAGAPIDAINTVRKCVSAIKGGRLATLCAPARLVTLAISDVPGDDPAVIASGPTVPAGISAEDAKSVLTRYDITPSPAIASWLDSPDADPPPQDDAAFANSAFHLVARPRDALEAASVVLSQSGFEIIDLGDGIEGEARDMATEHAQQARKLAAEGRRAVLLSGGELTVTLRGDGRGGPNQEYALALALALDGAAGISALAADTDGTDGGSGATTDPAGALVFPDTLSRAQALGLDAQDFLNRNDSTQFFQTLGHLVAPGPTQTNVNDLRIVLVDRRP